MENLKRAVTLLIALAMIAFGVAVAQNDQVDTRTVNGEEFIPVGEVDVSEPQPFDTETEAVEVAVETGTLILTGSTPDDQHPNIDLVGPDGYYEHFDVSDEPDEEFVVEGLLPGVYSVAATDENLQLAHTLVEVVAGQAVRVDLDLGLAATDFVPGRYAVGPDTVYPDAAFEAGAPTPIESNEFGEVAVETEDDDALFVVTGPNGYSRDFSGSFVASDLLPGVYTIVGTAEGSKIATSTFEVEVSTARVMVPVLEVTAETEAVEGDVAGGGQAEEDQSEEAADPADVEAEPAEDAPDGDGQQY